MIGHPDLHRVLKELVKFESELKDTKLEFTNQLASVMLKNVDSCLESRAAWIFVEMLEHENTKHLVFDSLKQQAKTIKGLISASKKGNKGLEVILEKIKK